MTLEILDSTLRDGAQGEDVSFSISDKLAIVRILSSLGISIIEAGNPASNPKDAEFFQEAKKLSLGACRLAAFGSTRRKHIRAFSERPLRCMWSMCWKPPLPKTWL